MKRKIEDFLRELQPEHAEAALAEFNKPESAKWRIEAERNAFAESHEEALWHAFPFGRSNTAWTIVHEQLENGTYIFPSPQESQDELWKEYERLYSLEYGQISTTVFSKFHELRKSKFKIERI